MFTTNAGGDPLALSLANSNSDSATKPCSPIACAILSAMDEELEFFRHHLAQHSSHKVELNGFNFTIYHYNNAYILLACTGLGTTFASCVFTLVLQHFHPAVTFFLGTAGGIRAGLKIRDVVVVEKAFEAELQGLFEAVKGTPFENCLRHPLKQENFSSVYSADHALLALLKEIDFDDIAIHQGTVVSSNHFPAPPVLFEQIKSADPFAIDMETSAIYQVAWLLKARVLAVRGISNLLNHDGTDDAMDQADIKGSTQAAGKVLLKILDKVLFHLSNQQSDEATQVISKFQLSPHPEGGYYRRVYKSKELVKKAIPFLDHHQESRSAGTLIYYLLKGQDFSAWHQLNSDEIWHFYQGSAVKIYIIDKQGQLSIELLGNPFNEAQASFQVVIPAGHWFAAEIVDKAQYSLVGCTVHPGFEFKDFILGDLQQLCAKFPMHQDLFVKFSRHPSAQGLAIDSPN